MQMIFGALCQVTRSYSGFHRRGSMGLSRR
jgi:hypothetical protein